MHDDLIDGKRWAVEQGHVHPNRVAVMGASFGGYAALAGLAFTPDEFACGVAISGPSNLVTYLSNSSEAQGPLAAFWYRRVGDPERDRDFLQSRSPLFHAHRMERPLLILHGANDPNVPLNESDQIVETMRDRNLPVEYIVFPDEGHRIAKPKNKRRLMAAVERFLAGCLGGRSEPPSEGESWQALLH